MLPARPRSPGLAFTGPCFRRRVEAIVERFMEMQDDLADERNAMTRLWVKREAQIRAVIESTAGMYRELQGIAGQALEEIEGFALPSTRDDIQAAFSTALEARGPTGIAIPIEHEIRPLVPLVPDA